MLGIESNNRNSQIFIILLGLSFLSTFATAMISTPIPYMVRELVTGSDIEEATMHAYGLLLSLGYVGLTLGSLFGGFTADALGRKKVILMSFGVLAASCGFFAIAPNLNFLFFASFVEMFAMGISRPAIMALIADHGAKGSRGMDFGLFNISWMAAQIPAPLLGGIFTQFLNMRITFAIALCIAVAGILPAILLKEKNLKLQRTQKQETTGQTEPFLASKSSFLIKVAFVFGMTSLLDGLLSGFFASLSRGFLVFRLGANPTEFGLVSSIAFGIVSGLVQIPGGKLADKFGRKPLVLIGFLGAPFCFLTAFSGSLIEFTLLIGAGCAVGNVSYPAIFAWMMDLVPESKRASVSGITRTLNGVGMSAGPVAGSFVWNIMKPNTVVPFGVAALILTSSLPFYLMLKDSRRKST